MKIDAKVKDGQRTVTVDGSLLLPDRSQALRNHSPDGFAWGYEGSGPAQLALALLLHSGLNDQIALHVHQAFKREVIARQPFDKDWTLEMDVHKWAKELRR